MGRKKIGLRLATSAFALPITRCWVPYLSPEVSYGFILSSKLGEPVHTYSGQVYQTDLGDNLSEPVFILSSGVENPENPEYSPVAKGLLVTRNSGAYVADYFAKQEAPTAGIALSVGSLYYVVSGLWGDAVITYLYDVTNANVRSQKSVDRLLSGQFSNGIVYSQNRESVTFYNALADKKLFSIMTGNLGLIDWRGYFPWCFQGSVHPDFLQLEQKLSGSERLRVSDLKARRSRKLIRGVID